MSSFSQRFGYAPIEVDLAEKDMPRSLRDGLWNAARAYFLSDVRVTSRVGRVSYSEAFDVVSKAIWFDFLRESIDDRPSHPETALQSLREKYSNLAFNRVYEFVEFLASLAYDQSQLQCDFIESCNKILERERSAFRFAGGTLVKVTRKLELDEIAVAVTQDRAFAIGAHIRRAAQLYSQFPPDYRNSIKESISAVEAAVAFITGEKPSGVSKPLRKAIDRISVHPALREGFEKLYAYASDSNGIRHALMEEDSLSQADARYMMISCSAFSNYLLAQKT